MSDGSVWASWDFHHNTNSPVTQKCVKKNSTRIQCRVLLLTACISFVAMIYHLIICFPSPHVMPRVDLTGYRRFAAWACSWWVSNIMWNPRTEDVWEQIEALPRISTAFPMKCSLRLFAWLNYFLSCSLPCCIPLCSSRKTKHIDFDKDGDRVVSVSCLEAGSTYKPANQTWLWDWFFLSLTLPSHFGLEKSRPTTVVSFDL